MIKIIDDYKVLKDLIDVSIDEKAETVLATKDDIKHLPTKEEFYNREDKLMHELKSVREEVGVLSGLQSQVNDQEERLGNIEIKLDIQPSI